MATVNLSAIVTPSNVLTDTNTVTGITNKTFVAPVLGTPASGDLRNCSLAVPPAIGGTTPAAGNFTTLSATGKITSTVGTGEVFLAPGGSTHALYETLANNGGNFRWGAEGVAGGTIFPGTIAYSAVFGSDYTTTHIVAGNAVAGTYNNTGQKLAGSLSLGDSALQNGTGITFPATQNPSSNANTLDDYEEGTWTPGIAFGGGTTGITYSAGNIGAYTKIGRSVLLVANCLLTNKGSSTGAATLTGLPFAASSAATYNPLSVTPTAYTYSVVATVVVMPSDTKLLLQQVSAIGGNTNLANTAFTNDSGVNINGTYFV